MKKDLITIVITAIAGFLAAYFITNMIFPGLENFTFKNLTDAANFSITEPSEDIFNFRAINPTVEVYVGQCKEYNAAGECIESFTEEDIVESDPSASDDSSSEEPAKEPQEETNG